MQYTYIPGNPGVEFCELQPVTGWDWCLAHSKCLSPVSTHSKCVLAGIFSFFLPSSSPKPDTFLLPSLSSPYLYSLARSGVAPSCLLECSLSLWPGSACTAPLLPDCLHGPHHPCLFPVLDLGSPACPSRPGCFSEPPLDLSEPSSQVSPPGYPLIL